MKCYYCQTPYSVKCMICRKNPGIIEVTCSESWTQIIYKHKDQEYYVNVDLRNNETVISEYRVKTIATFSGAPLNPINIAKKFPIYLLMS